MFPRRDALAAGSLIAALLVITVMNQWVVMGSVDTSDELSHDAIEAAILGDVEVSFAQQTREVAAIVDLSSRVGSLKSARIDDHTALAQPIRASQDSIGSTAAISRS